MEESMDLSAHQEVLKMVKKSVPIDMPDITFEPKAENSALGLTDTAELVSNDPPLVVNMDVDNSTKEKPPKHHASNLNTDKSNVFIIDANMKAHDVGGITLETGGDGALDMGLQEKLAVTIDETVCYLVDKQAIVFENNPEKAADDTSVESAMVKLHGSGTGDKATIKVTKNVEVTSKNEILTAKGEPDATLNEDVDHSTAIGTTGNEILLQVTSNTQAHKQVDVDEVKSGNNVPEDIKEIASEAIGETMDLRDNNELENNGIPSEVTNEPVEGIVSLKGLVSSDSPLETVSDETEVCSSAALVVLDETRGSEEASLSLNISLVAVHPKDEATDDVPEESIAVNAQQEAWSCGKDMMENAAIVNENSQEVSTPEALSLSEETNSTSTRSIALVDESMPKLLSLSESIVENETDSNVLQKAETINETVFTAEDLCKAEISYSSANSSKMPSSANQFETEIISGDSTTETNFYIVSSYNPDEENNIVQISVVSEDMMEKTENQTVVLAEEVPEITTTAAEGKKKEKKMKIPNHVLGRNIRNPSSEVVRNGKPAPKPRVGVKIPHRNLTSQIVSKQEIANVLLERQRHRSAPSYGEKTFFARKLTKALANRIAPAPKNKTGSLLQAKKKEPQSTSMENSDLIAILEGKEEKPPVLIKQQHNSSSKEERAVDLESVPENEFVKALEQQLALKQLGELQMKRRTVRKKYAQDFTPQRRAAHFVPKENEKVVVVVGKTLGKNLGLEMHKEAEQQAAKVTLKQQSDSEATEDIDMAESNFKSNVPFKTYTRKRKSCDEYPPTEEPPQQTIAKPTTSLQKENVERKLAIPPNMYVTKSSRVIKRKVIWDPDEVPSRLSTSKILKRTDKAPAVLKVLEKAPKPDAAAADDDDDVVTTPPAAVQSPLGMISKIPKPELKGEKKSPLGLKKRLTEVDKLLMDEGAVNMLYAVKNDEMVIQKKRKPSLISLDKAHKELLHKTHEIKIDLHTNTSKVSPKSLRKKDQTAPSPSPRKQQVVPGTVTRQKSRDSARSSIQSPPASPGYQHPEASRIIRRHSSDSFSSDEDDEQKGIRDEKKVDRVTRSKKNHDEQKPKKSSKKADTESLSLEEKQKINDELSKKFSKLIETDSNENVAYPSVTIKKSDGFVNIVMAGMDERVLLTIEIMKDVSEILTDVAKDDNCQVVLITSSGTSFCHGIDYKSLVSDKESSRKKIVKETATAVKEFLMCLANFPKILVCGVHGDVMDMGAMILPLFDVVLACDGSTFSTRYAKLGCLAEGTSLLVPSDLNYKIIVHELLYSSKKLLAAEAVRIGLVTKILRPDKFQEELLSGVQAISKQSSQFMLATKMMLRQSRINVEAALAEETELLIKHWSSKECQDSFKRHG